jgi:hypothetical protein
LLQWRLHPQTNRIPQLPARWFWPVRFTLVRVTLLGYREA